MHARILLVAIALLVALTVSDAVAQRYNQPVTTQNFAVYANDPAFANRVAQEAERYRRELSIEWLGYEISPWEERCPISVEIGLHAGGETSFAFVTPPQGGRGFPTGWQMKIFGPPDRLLDAVLPHEVTHTIFATHFGRPLPRWADEGACTTVEHVSERQKNHNMLVSFLGGTPSRGIPFNRMFTMRNYPNDILPLYAQGYSLAKFLIQKKGRRPFLNYLETGMNNERPGVELAAWDQATSEHYGYRDLSDLQLAWMDWLKNGAAAEQEQPMIAARPTNADGAQRSDPRFVAAARQPQNNGSGQRGIGAGRPAESVANLPINQGWYAKQMKVNQSSRRIAASRQTIDVPIAADESDEAVESVLEPAQVVLPPNPSKTIWR